MSTSDRRPPETGTSSLGLTPELERAWLEIQKHASHDIRAVAGNKLRDDELERVTLEATARLEASLKQTQPQTFTEIADRWNRIVADLYTEGFQISKLSSSHIAETASSSSPVASSQSTTETPTSSSRAAVEEVSSRKLIAYIRTFFLPTIVMKIAIYYFGLQYSMYPGEGYGYGLAISLSITLSSFAYFIWSYRHDTEDEERRLKEREAEQLKSKRGREAEQLKVNRGREAEQTVDKRF